MDWTEHKPPLQELKPLKNNFQIHRALQTWSLLHFRDEHLISYNFVFYLRSSEFKIGVFYKLPWKMQCRQNMKTLHTLYILDIRSLMFENLIFLISSMENVVLMSCIWARGKESDVGRPLPLPDMQGQHCGFYSVDMCDWGFFAYQGSSCSTKLNTAFVRLQRNQFPAGNLGTINVH